MKSIEKYRTSMESTGIDFLNWAVPIGFIIAIVIPAFWWGFAETHPETVTLPLLGLFVGMFYRVASRKINYVTLTLIYLPGVLLTGSNLIHIATHSAFFVCIFFVATVYLAVRFIAQYVPTISVEQKLN